MYRLSNIKIRDNYTENEVIEYALKKYHIKKNNVKEAYIYKRSIDARNKNDIFFNYSVDIDLIKDYKINGATFIEKEVFPSILVNRKSNLNPVIIGAGPAGLFAALTLVENGIKPIIFEQG